LVIYTFFIFPGFFLYLFYGIYLIPVFTYLIVREDLSIYEIGKKVIPYIPLIIGFTILIYTLIGFLGLLSVSGIQIGYDIASARVNFIDAPWAFIFPNLAIIILLLGFFLLYAGLQKSPEEMQELKRA
jgi:ABC-type dipeptide/oligopeptide/nickel transport system permease subunit